MSRSRTLALPLALALLAVGCNNATGDCNDSDTDTIDLSQNNTLDGDNSAADELYGMGGDDTISGFGGTDVLSSNSQGNFGSTSSVTGGVMAFRLLYWNNATEGRLVLTIDGESASAAAAPGAEVPLPAAGLLLVTALGGLGGVSAFRRRAA